LVQVKICGINTPQALDAASRAGADWIGFNFFPRSPRYVTPVQAASIAAASPGGPARVGLFVEPMDEAVEEACRAIHLDVLQIYAPLPRAAALRARLGIPVWGIASLASPADLPREAPGLDALLVEPKPPAGATRPGGNGATFDWSVLQGWNAPTPWLLAGGLTPDNVAQAIRQSGARAVDVSSGVERAPGQKDSALIVQFVENSRSAD